MKFRRVTQRDDEVIPTASMADIVFLLIIFFMVTSVFNLDRGLEMKLPQMERAGQISRKGIVVSIDARGSVYVDGSPVELQDVGRRVYEKREKSPGAPVIFKSDRDTKYQKIMDVLDELMKAGIYDVSLPVVEEKKGEGGGKGK
ncbi:MAG: biopolymer transporter ExbD [Deltaproteobacteria bacterium]|nr:MAG: biopolymer transporter ExbD [Deltaproteobacteria bacterium]